MPLRGICPDSIVELGFLHPCEKHPELRQSVNRYALHMPTHLRRLTIFVDEPDPGCFYWVLIESTDDAAIWRDVTAALDPAGTWREAWDLGTQALHILVRDQAIGPRAEGEDENASPVG